MLPLIFNERGHSMVIQRESYLNALKIRMHNGMIKVVTGIRRSGKSFLIFNIFKKYLMEIGTDKAHIIEIQLDLRQNRKYRDPDVILEYIEKEQ